MKKSTFARGLAPLAACSLLLPPAVTAQTPYTATGWVTGAPVPGIWQTNALGQVIMRGNAHLVRVESTDPRLTGQRLIFVDGNAQADGTALIWGGSYQQVGTFDATGQFTPAGGIWQNTYRGTLGADNSLQLHSVGYGWGGTIDGLRIDETMTRAAASGPIDPAIPYEYAGTLKPPPVTTSQVFDNFDGIPVGWTAEYEKGTGGAIVANGQCTVWGDFPGVITTSTHDTYVVMVPTTAPLEVEDGQTLESRVDLVSLNDEATAAMLSLGRPGGVYWFMKARGSIALAKYTSQNDNSILACEPTEVRNANVILALAVTRVDPNVIVTARVLDKADPNVVLCVLTIVDTPQADPSLTTNEYAQISGMRLVGLTRDAAGKPLTAFRPDLWVFQYNDGTKGRAEATFDNLELRTSELPPVSIARAVQVSWPAPAGVNYSLEAAPTVRGPWQPVQDPSSPGLRTIAVPATRAMEVFRLIPTPYQAP